ncbi:hypothetical protein CLOP_g20062 [Closterium sp. NIES-67]|nr:hypothetical protein CLOP_g20062 [Closterium sp. NIES-67]
MDSDDNTDQAEPPPRNGLSVLGVFPLFPPTIPNVQPTSPPRPSRLSPPRHQKYPFEPVSPLCSSHDDMPDLDVEHVEGTSEPAASSRESPVDASTKRKASAHWTQRPLPWAPPPKKPAPAPNPPPPTPSSGLNPSSPADAEYAIIKRRFVDDWSRRFPWLLLTQMKNGRPALKCAVCLQFGDAFSNTNYGKKGEGARDLQVGSIRIHVGTRAHKNALKAKEEREREKEQQRTLDRWRTSDSSTKHLIRYGFKQGTKAISNYLRDEQLQHLLSSPYVGIAIDESTDRVHGKHMILYATFFRGSHVVTEFVALLSVERTDAASLTAVLLQFLSSIGLDLQRIVGMSTDGASVMTGATSGVVTRLKSRILHLVATHCIAHREALAAKDAAAAVTELNVIDILIRAFADLVGRSNIQHSSFKNFQLVYCNTNLEAQGIYAIRWLSRGEAVVRFVEVLPAAVVLLRGHPGGLYEIVTSFKVQYMLYFLADILEELNHLNTRFQQRQVDMTVVSSLVDNTCNRITDRYIKCGGGVYFGNGGSVRLGEFLQAHGSPNNRRVCVQGVDNKGNAQSFEYVLHERMVDGHTSESDLDSCAVVCRKFAVELVGSVRGRLRSLSDMEGCKLYKAKTYPLDDEMRLARCKQWLKQNHGLFGGKLPGFDNNKAVQELWVFTAAMMSQYKDDGFHQGLALTLDNNEWQRSYPYILRLWQALAVLPLSTVECERGFSKQNLIKSWERGCLGDDTLGDLMRCSLLQYNIEWFDVVAVFRGEKPRRPLRDLSSSNPTSVEDGGASTSEPTPLVEPRG